MMHSSHLQILTDLSTAPLLPRILPEKFATEAEANKLRDYSDPALCELLAARKGKMDLPRKRMAVGGWEAVIAVQPA
jgi:hypothetical protein